MIKFVVIVDTKAALLAGKTVVGEAAVAWHDADVEKLSVAQRHALFEALTEPLGSRLDDLPLKDAEFDTLVEGLQHRVAARAAREVEERRQADAAAAAAARADEEDKARRRVQEEQEAKRRVAVQKWIDKNGTASQKARNKENLLPEREVLEAIRDQLLDELDTYEHLTRPTPNDGCTCACAGDVKVTPDYPRGMTEEQYARLVEIRNEAPKDAKVTPIVWEARCHGGCDCKPVSALGAAVQLLWNGFILTREYAL